MIFVVLRVQESSAQREPGGIAKRKLGRFSSELEEAEEGHERSMARSRTQRTVANGNLWGTMGSGSEVYQRFPKKVLTGSGNTIRRT